MRILLLILVALLATPLTAHAQSLVGTDTAPGDSCAGIAEGATRMSADADQDGKNITLICDGTVWLAAQSSPIVFGESTTPCGVDTEGGAQWNSDESCLEICNGSIWQCLQTSICPNSLPHTFAFTNQVSVVPSTVVSSDVVQISGVDGCTVEVSITGDGSPEYRLCSDEECAAVVQDWTAAKTGVENGQYIQLRLMSSFSGGQTFAASASVGARVVGWMVSTDGDCAGPNPPIGTIRSDGTVYAGLSPDTGTKMYTTPCRMGRTWDGSSCSGPVMQAYFSAGGTIFNGITNPSTGEANTIALAALTNADSPYSRAILCRDFAFGGHDDWYLPAMNEGHQALAAFKESHFELYTSTEVNSAHVKTTTTNRSKTADVPIICTRKD